MADSTDIVAHTCLAVDSATQDAEFKIISKQESYIEDLIIEISSVVESSIQNLDKNKAYSFSEIAE